METAHAIRELISKPLSSMIAILDKQGVEEGRGPRCTIMLMHCRRLHGFSTRRQIFTLLLLNVAR
jgi:hypothetical protein